MKNAALKLTVPVEMQYLSTVQDFVTGTAAKFGFGEAEISQLELAIEEAVSNVVKHSCLDDEDNSFEVTCRRIPLGIEIVIRERGIPFDPAALPKYNPESNPLEGSTAGLGMFLIEKMVDQISAHNLGMEGKELRLIKYLPDKKITDLIDPNQLTQEADRELPKEPAVIREKIPYTVRRMEAHEAIQVSRCAYKSHGYTFFDDHIYYPERLLQLNQSGELISAVAVTEDNVFMGHAALHYPAPGARIAELTFVFVNVEYRGQGCMNRLTEFLFETPKQAPLAGIYAYAVANHIFTQKVMVKFGVGDCGILLATSPATWKFKGIAADDSQRISTVLSFKYLEVPPQLTLYPPARHRPMIEKLYRTIGAPHLFVDAPARVPEGPSVVETNVFASENCAEMSLLRSGSDAVQEVRRQLRELCLKQIAAIQLFLSLEDPATAALTAEFETLGFFFAGILPHGAVGETLILQYLNNVPLDYGKVLAYTEIAQEMLGYIKSCDPNV